MTASAVSSFQNASDTIPRDLDVSVVLKAIRTGGKKLQGQIEQIRNRFQAELAITGDYKKAKLAVDPLKKQLPGVTWTGTFSGRASDKLIQHSGLLVADLDSLGEKLADIRKKLLNSPHVWALFVSPTGDGLKAVHRVSADSQKHPASWRAVQKHVLELTGVQVDQSGKDPARLCFLSFDPDLYHNPNAVGIEPVVEPEKPRPRVFSPNGVVDLNARQRIAFELLGEIRWDSETHGFFPCPGKYLHTTVDGHRDCEIHLDGAPTIHCFHDHCRGMVDGINHELRSRIGEAERAAKAAEQDEADHDESKEEDDKQLTQKSAATRLVELAEEYSFFHDPQDRPFGRLEINGHTEVWLVESSKFRKLLARTYYKRTGKAINRNALADAITTLAGRACHDGPEERVFLRVAPYGENILIDLCDQQWRVVEVTPNESRVLEKSPVAFVRTGSMQSSPEPERAGSIEPLWDLLNITKLQRPLLAGALLNAFHPQGPYFVLNFIGEQGTAKSCAARMVRQLVDPNENPLRSPPKEERDLLAQAASNRCVALDNLSSLPPWLSDALCRLATGGGHSARTLYTDLEEISLAVKRPVILNGIEDVATRPDLAERVLQIELETIPDQKRISEKDLWREFDSQRSAIFSALLDALVCALRELPSITLDLLPRMADAALWATAGEIAFGWERGTFIAAYRQNLNEGAIASVEAHPIGVAIRQLLEKQNDWSGEPAQLLQALNGLVSDEQRHARAWPENARSLGHCLRRLATALRRVGIEVERDKGTRRIIHLYKAREKTSETSEMLGNGITKDDQDVSDDPSPQLHDPLITEAINMFNATVKKPNGIGGYEELTVTD
jgi:BT4734-like, N-terminal domain